MTSSLNPIAFLSEVRLELQKVVWPTREETFRLTAIVIVVSVFVALFVGSLDLLFTHLLSAVLGNG